MRRGRLFSRGNGDASEFVDTVESIVRGRLLGEPTKAVYALKLDNWFDHKWLNFVGTIYPISIWSGKLRIPPFVPERIIETRKYVWSPESERYDCRDAEVVHEGPLGVTELLNKFIAPLADGSGLFVWMSGNTLSNGRGSLMVYDIVGDQQDSWYCGFTEKNGCWKLGRCQGTSPTVVEFFQEKGESEDLGFGGSPPQELTNRRVRIVGRL